METVADLDELLLGDAYLPVGYYEQYNSSVAQPYNTFIHMMSDEIQQNRSTNENEHSAMLSSEDKHSLTLPYRSFSASLEIQEAESLHSVTAG